LVKDITIYRVLMNISFSDPNSQFLPSFLYPYISANVSCGPRGGVHVGCIACRSAR
jgi:hypothetical protein